MFHKVFGGAKAVKILQGLLGAGRYLYWITWDSWKRQRSFQAHKPIFTCEREAPVLSTNIQVSLQTTQDFDGPSV